MLTGIALSKSTLIATSSPEVRLNPKKVDLPMCFLRQYLSLSGASITTGREKGSMMIKVRKGRDRTLKLDVDELGSMGKIEVKMRVYAFNAR